MHCGAVARASAVSVIVIDWTTTGRAAADLDVADLHAHGRVAFPLAHRHFNLPDARGPEVSARRATHPYVVRCARLGSHRWRPPRPLRDPRADRRGRDGGGVQGARHAARADGRRQGTSPAPFFFARGPAALRAGSENDLAALAPPHLRAVRRGARRRARVPGDGAARGRDALGSACQGTAAARSDAALRSRDRRRARQGAPAGDRAPRPEARQRDADAVGREAARLRAREGR